MRMLLKMRLPVEAGNAAIQDGRVNEVIGRLMERLQPEAAYFGAEKGDRTAYVFFDMADPSRIPVIAEPLFQGLNASVYFAPVMTIEDLQAGLQEHAQGT